MKDVLRDLLGDIRDGCGSRCEMGGKVVVYECTWGCATRLCGTAESGGVRGSSCFVGLQCDQDERSSIGSGRMESCIW